MTTAGFLFFSLTTLITLLPFQGKKKNLLEGFGYEPISQEVEEEREWQEIGLFQMES